MLSGLLFAFMPLAIYLLINRKKVVIRWAAYEWMLKAKLKRRKQNRIDDILKLLAKTLLLIILVLFMARPALLSGSGGSRILVIDSSLSMGAILDERSRLEKAKELAKGLVDSAGSPSGIYFFDGSLKPLSKTKLPERAAKALVDSIELSPGGGSFNDLVSALIDLPSFKEIDSIAFISDFQKLQYQDTAATAQAVRRLSGKRLELIPVDPRSNLRNISVDSFQAPPEGFIPGKANRVLVKVSNHSPLPSEPVQITLSVNGEKRERGSIALPPNSSGVLALSLSLPPDEESRVSVEAPPDCFPYDNTLCVVAAPKGSPNILSLVKEKGDAPFEYDVFFRNAMMAFLGGSRVKCKAVSPQRVFDEDLDNYDLIVSYGVPFSSRNGVTDAVLGFLRKGKPLIAFSDLYSDGYWKALSLESGKVSGPGSLDPSRLDGGYLEFMKGSGLDPSLVAFSKFAPISLDGLKDAAGRLYVSGVKDPIAVRLKKDGGSAALFGFLPALGYTNFFYNPNFIQFAMRVFAEASARDVFSCFAGEGIRAIPLPPGVSVDGAFSLASSDGRSEPLELKRLEPAGALLVGKPSLDSSFCLVKRDAETLFGLGRNATREESDVEPASAQQFKEASAAGAVYCSSPSAMKGSKASSELPVLMALLLLSAIAFDVYAHFRRRA